MQSVDCLTCNRRKASDRIVISFFLARANPITPLPMPWDQASAQMIFPSSNDENQYLPQINTYREYQQVHRAFNPTLATHPNILDKTNTAQCALKRRRVTLSDGGGALAFGPGGDGGREGRNSSGSAEMEDRERFRCCRNCRCCRCCRSCRCLAAASV